jgi:superfamily I DNA/RNA helicase
MPGAKEFIDFSDMVEKAITSNIKSKAKVLLLDEAQDFTPLHWKAIYTAFKDVEEMYVAGDPMQALYRFHGGISDYMYDMRADETVILDEGHRCSEPIIKMAQLVANQMERHTPLPTWKNMLKDNFAVFYPDSNILPLFQAVNYSRRHGWKVMILANTFRQLVLIKNRLLGKYSQTYPSHSISGKHKEFYRGGEKNPLVFSTVHQAKGLEYDNVLVIDTTINCMEDLNIAYVALTRAKDNLFVINWQQFEMLFDMYMGH